MTVSSSLPSVTPRGLVLQRPCREEELEEVNRILAAPELFVGVWLLLSARSHARCLGLLDVGRHPCVGRAPPFWEPVCCSLRWIVNALAHACVASQGCCSQHGPLCSARPSFFCRDLSRWLEGGYLPGVSCSEGSNLHGLLRPRRVCAGQRHSPHLLAESLLPRALQLPHGPGVM